MIIQGRIFCYSNGLFIYIERKKKIYNHWKENTCLHISVMFCLTSTDSKKKNMLWWISVSLFLLTSSRFYDFIGDFSWETKKEEIIVCTKPTFARRWQITEKQNKVSCRITIGWIRRFQEKVENWIEIMQEVGSQRLDES